MTIIHRRQGDSTTWEVVAASDLRAGDLIYRDEGDRMIRPELVTADGTLDSTERIDVQQVETALATQEAIDRYAALCMDPPTYILAAEQEVTRLQDEDPPDANRVVALRLLIDGMYMTEVHKQPVAMAPRRIWGTPSSAQRLD